jgi:outer membrane protein assembly factor BamB
MFCYNLDGVLQWKADLGLLRSAPENDAKLEWGFASSPIIYQDKVVMQCDIVGGGFIALLDIRTGKELRRIPRDDVPSWTTPTVYEHEGRAQIICNGYRHMGAYDLLTGQELWRLAGRGDIPVPRPVIADGLIYITSNHKGRATYAIQPSAQGDVTPRGETTPPGLAWWNGRLGSYLPVPLVYDGILYVPDERGMVSAFDAKTGQAHYTQERWVQGEGARYYASPVAAAGRLYQPSLTGHIHVLQTGKKFERLATNKLEESCFATPAIVDGRLFIRTRGHLYCIGRQVSLSQ